MTGRDLIIYILQNNLEDNDFIKEDGTIDVSVIGLADIYDTAVRLDVGISTVLVWYKLGKIKGVKISDSLYFSKDLKDPRLE